MTESRAAGDPSGRVLVVFVKAPDPGRVKTRLARELGNEAAARIYRELGRRAVDALRPGAYRMVVYFDPPDAGPRIRRWLDGDDLELLAQPAGSLGTRLEHAFRAGFELGGRVCVVGTDVPELSYGAVERAFEAIEDPGAVDAYFGPALDGGYYLLALRSPAPALFRDIPWSTSRVLATSRDRAESEGLVVALGESLADVDRPEDVPDTLLRSRESGAPRARPTADET